MNQLLRKHYRDVCGIYKITNTSNLRVYVGGSVDLYGRCKQHTLELKKNKHGNPNLQNDYNLCGESCFEFEVLELCSRDVILDREQYWMDRYTCYDMSVGYNCARYSHTTKGTKQSDRAREKYLKMRKDPAWIQNTCDKLREYYKTDAWAEKRKEVSERVKIQASEWNKNPVIKEKRYSKCRHPYIFISPDGSMTYSKNAKQFCIEHDLVYPYMIKTLPDHTEHRDNHRGWKLRRFSESLITPQSKILVES